MSTKITTAFGHAVPPAPHHAVTVHMPGWETVERYGQDARSVINTFYDSYPRAKPHRDIAKLSDIILSRLGLSGQCSFLFSSLQSAKECLQFASSSKRDDGKEKDHVPADAICIRAFKARDHFWAVIFAEQYLPLVQGFWSRPGVGVSSRFAETNLAFCEQLQQVDAFDGKTDRLNFEGSDHQALRERIISCQNRAAEHFTNPAVLTSADVYLFPSGMANIYKTHIYLSKLYNGKTVLFGMAFKDTIVALEEYGSGFKFLGLGSDDDLAALEVYLQEQQELGHKVQAIWAEFPANPILVTPNLVQLRALADKYDVLLAIDDTIAGFANVAILHMTDWLVTSLTKSFNGYADAIAGSVILNPHTRHYTELKALFAQHYIPELYVEEAKILLHNNADYLERMTKLNYNAKALVEYLQTCAEDPNSAVARVHYPTVNPSGKNYTQFLRKSTPEFAPGVHLGAPFTLAFAYTMCIYGQNLDWAAKYGLKATQIRITAGLEDTDMLLKDFQNAVEAANSVKSSRHN